MFSEALKNKIKEYVGRYETKRSAILPILHSIQDENGGWIKAEDIDELETAFAFEPVHIKEVISFYDIYLDKECKKYHVRFCNNVTCYMKGSQKIIDHLKGRFKKDGEAGEFEVTPFACLGKCDGAPVMLINKERFENITLENVDQAIDGMVGR